MTGLPTDSCPSVDRKFLTVFLVLPLTYFFSCSVVTKMPGLVVLRLVISVLVKLKRSSMLAVLTQPRLKSQPETSGGLNRSCPMLRDSAEGTFEVRAGSLTVVPGL